MKLLDVVHPAAKTLVDISLSQDAEVSKFCHHNYMYTDDDDVTLVTSELCMG